MIASDNISKGFVEISKCHFTSKEQGSSRLCYELAHLVGKILHSLSKSSKLCIIMN